MRTFTHHSMSSLFNLQGLIIYQIAENQKGFSVRVGQPRRPSFCPFCHSLKIEKHSRGRIRRIRHGISLTGQPIYLLWRSTRFRCRSCKKTWTLRPPPSLVQGKQRSTSHCRLQALRTLQSNSFNNTEKQHGLSYPVLRSTLHHFFISQEVLPRIPQDQDIILGIDEHSRAKQKLALTITLLKPERRLLALLPQATIENLVSWVNEHMAERERHQVMEIVMDMKKSLRKQLSLLFPSARFVIDQFHVVAYLNTLISREYSAAKKDLSPLRKRLLPYREKGLGIARLLYQGGDHWTPRQKDKISSVFHLFSEIAKLWYIKEEVRAIYRECQDRNEARKRWQYVLDNLPQPYKRTLSKFLEEILNYFDNYSTNAFTEGVHTKFKLIKRLSFGLRNPQVYVEKLSLGFIEPKLLTFTHTF